MTPPTLLVLAAGMGSRYGGLKQLAPMGPAGETLLDYSVHDAVCAGFNRVVFVIRRDFAEQFKTELGARFERRLEVGYVFQELDALPEGTRPPAGRHKPWGTGHAIWCAREAVRAPFAAINADDFYGRDAYRVLADFFAHPAGARGTAADAPARFAMVAYQLRRTLSEHGTVSRGVCSVGPGGQLAGVVERTNIEAVAAGAAARYAAADGTWVDLSGDETVSLNFWGFTPEVFPLLEAGLTRFLQAGGLEQPKAEFYIPAAVATMIKAGEATVSVLPTTARWFGVTYQEDRPLVAGALAELTRQGEYPAA